MNKKIKYATNGAWIFGISSMFLNWINQLERMDKEPERGFDWSEFFGSGLKGAAAGGVGGFLIGAMADFNNTHVRPIDSDALLYSFINEIRLHKEDSIYTTLNEKAIKLIELLKSEFGDKIAGEPIRLGSTENGTALADDFDIDVCIPFKPESFSSTSEMYSCLYDCLERLVGKQSIVTIRGQKKSIGVILELRGEKRRIDIVPFKLTAKKGNGTSGYLYVNDPYYPTYTKTDIEMLKRFRLSATQKKILIALKYWKRKYNVPIGSHLLQNLIVDAYNRNRVPGRFTDKIIMVLRHIRNNMDVAVIRSVENTNNILTNISESKKAEIVRACKEIIEEFEYQPNSIVNFLNYASPK